MCVIVQPYDMEVGAGTFHPATTFKVPRDKTLEKLHMSSHQGGQQIEAYGNNPIDYKDYYQFQVW